MPPSPRRPCSVDGCDDKSTAKGLCNRHYHRARRAAGLVKGKNPVVVVSALVSLRGAYAITPQRVKCRITVGAMAYCPGCRGYMNAFDPVRRVCLTCGTTAVLNEEEVEWAISEKRSTAA